MRLLHAAAPSARGPSPKPVVVLGLTLAMLVAGSRQALAQPFRPPEPAPSGSANAGMPAGHPPTGGMPAGHPQVDDDDEEPAGNPHAVNPHAGGGAPSGGGKGSMAGRVFEPPPDTAQDDPTLPAGSVVISILDAQGQPLSHAPLSFGVLRNTVAKGESSDKLAREADEQGQVRFDNLAFGSGVTYRVSTTRMGATYAMPPFALGDKIGKRVAIHAYEVASNIDEMPIALQAIAYASLKEDSIQVEHLITVYNLGPVAWQANQSITLPAGFKAFNKQEGTGDARIEEESGKGAALRGTFPPGRTELNFRYQVPFSGDEKQTLRIQLPPRVAQARVLAESSKTMGLEVASFPPAQRTQGRDGKHLLVTEMQATRASGGVSSLDLTLSGLPVPSNGRWIAAGLAALALAIGLSQVLQKPAGPRGKAALDDDARAELKEAREALLGEIVDLERAHRNGEVGPKTYARVRASLLDALARIQGLLADAKPKAQPGGGAGGNKKIKRPRPRSQEEPAT